MPKAVPKHVMNLLLRCMFKERGSDGSCSSWYMEMIFSDKRGWKLPLIGGGAGIEGALIAGPDGP